jgi:hypothetical protein
MSKMCFEYFKHLTTLSTAAALVEITRYQQVGIDLVTLISSLITQGLVLLVSLGGWLLCLCEAEYRGVFARYHPYLGTSSYIIGSVSLRHRTHGIHCWRL